MEATERSGAISHRGSIIQVRKPGLVWFEYAQNSLPLAATGLSMFQILLATAFVNIAGTPGDEPISSCFRASGVMTREPIASISDLPHLPKTLVVHPRIDSHDGLQKAGFSLHGTISYLRCSTTCSAHVSHIPSVQS